MKIAFYVYPTAFQSPGGGEILLLKTKEHLEKLGVSITLLNPWKDKLKDFDILHTFGSVKDALPMMESASQQGVKNVLSSVCWYSLKSSWLTYPNYRKKLATTTRHLAKKYLPILPSKRKRMMQIADLVLPNSESEAKQLKDFFLVSEKKIQVVYNGVDDRFSHSSAKEFHEAYPFKDFVLLVGRIEPRKNQLNTIKALNHVDADVVIVGDPVTQYMDYYQQCRKEAGKHIHFIGGLDHESPLLKSAYAACQTYLLASWLETPGLAVLEAGLAGANIVVTKEGATREYFGDFVSYVDPGSTMDISTKTTESLKRQKNNAFSDYVRKKYLWSQVVRENIRAYEKVLA